MAKFIVVTEYKYYNTLIVSADSADEAVKRLVEPDDDFSTTIGAGGNNARVVQVTELTDPEN